MRAHRVRGLLTVVLVTVAAVGGLVAQTPSPPDGWVVLPVDEYRTLRASTLPPPSAPASPVDATLTRIDYELRAEADMLTGRALLTVDVLRDGWARVAVPPGLRAREARLDGQPVPLVEGPPPYVLLARAGRVVLSLDIAVPITLAGGAESVTLPASPSPISRLSMQLPRSGMDLTATGGFIAVRDEGDGERRWELFGTPNQPLNLSWKRRTDDRRAEGPLRYRARIVQLVALGEDSAQVSASIRIDVQQGLATEIPLRLPAGLVTTQVNGPAVGAWTVSGDTLRVSLLEPVASDVAFVVQGEMPAPRDGTIDVPLVRVSLAERETGGVAVDVLGAGEIAGRQSRSLEPGDPSELGDIIAGRESPSMIAFRLRPSSGTDERRLNVAVVRYTPQPVLIANVEEARYRTLASEDGRVLVEARYAVRNNQRSFLKVTLPPGASVWSAAVAGRPVRPGVAGSDAVLLPLQKGRAGAEAPTFLVSLVYLHTGQAWPARGDVRIMLPALDLPASRTGVRVFHSPRVAVSTASGPFRSDTDTGATAEAFRLPAPGAARAPLVREAVTVTNFNAHTSVADSELQALVERYQREDGVRTVVGAVPLTIGFPAVGPSLFLASELTPADQAPTIDLRIKRTK